MAPAAPLARWERRFLALLLLVVVLFGVVVEFRSAFLSRRMGDLGCYLRAAWAVRTGHELYQVTDNGWHYNYPPLLAILLVPLADPPPGADAAGMVPFAASAGLWYIFNVGCLVLAVHWLASALEHGSADPAVRAQPPGCRRWWALRILPLLACLTPVGHSLMRGQVNLLLLALLSGSMAAALRGRRFLSGLSLGATICIKIYPAFLLLYPLWRRDLRCLAGAALGLFLGLAVIPAAVFGPKQTMAYYQELAEVLIRPAMGTGTDQSRAKELIEVTATDSQSLLASLHNTLHLDPYTRPRQASTAVRLASMVVGGLMTVLTLLAAGWRRPQDGPASVVFFGLIILNMLLLCPVCHLHYFCLALPLVMGFLAASWERAATLRLWPGTALLLAAFALANVLGQFPAFQVLRDTGLAMYGALLLWAVGVIVLWKRPCQPRSGTSVHPMRLEAAA
jgi:hypothetical protein